MVTATNQKVNVCGQKTCLALGDELIALRSCPSCYKKTNQAKIETGTNTELWRRLFNLHGVIDCDSVAFPCILVKSGSFHRPLVSSITNAKQTWGAEGIQRIKQLLHQSSLTSSSAQSVTFNGITKSVPAIFVCSLHSW